MKTLITNGRIIDPSSGRDEKADLFIEDGKVSSGKAGKDVEVIDAKGCIVAPGFVDLHVHLREPGFEYKETIQTGTEAAAAGGFTSVCCMANTNPVNDQASVTNYIVRKAKESGVVKVFPIGALTKGLAGKELAHMGELKAAGCIAVSDDGKAVQNNYVMRLAMEYAKTFDLLVITHSIDADLTGKGVMNEGALATRLGLPGIPHQAEDIMVARDIYLCELTGARLHVAHVSTAGAVELVATAKKKGLPVTCEVAPHHFTLTDAAVCCYETDAKMAPPLRTQKDIDALKKGLSDGTIDAIATDHAPHALVDKEGEFESASCGVVGLETALGLSLKLVEEGVVTLPRLIELLSTAPSKIAGLGFGSLAKGSAADVVVFDPSTAYTVDPQQFRTKSKNSPFTGMTLKGQVRRTIVDGKTVYTN
jgi:dihydroorotase